MTRRFNYTGRQRITSDNFSARVVSDDPLVVSLQLDLSSLKLNPHDGIIVEPYSGSISKRILCGTVNSPEVPQRVDLTELRTGGSIQFRVKIADSMGRLAASGERIRLAGLNEDAGRKPLLPVETSPDLGELVWKLEVTESTHPKLILNSRISSIESRLLDDPTLSGAILLPAIRRILEVLSETPAGDVWQEDWLTFARRWEPDTNPEKDMNDDAREEWVDKIIDRFSKEQAFVKRAADELTKGKVA